MIYVDLEEAEKILENDRAMLIDTDKHDAELLDRFVEKCRGFEDLTFDKYQIQRIETIADELKAEVTENE